MTDVVIETIKPEQTARLAAVVGLPIEPLPISDPAHPSHRWYVCSVPADGDAGAIAHRLLQDPYVTSAYAKPPEAAP